MEDGLSEQVHILGEVLPRELLAKGFTFKGSIITRLPPPAPARLRAVHCLLFTILIFPPKPWIL